MSLWSLYCFAIAAIGFAGAFRIACNVAGVRALALLVLWLPMPLVVLGILAIMSGESWDAPGFGTQFVVLALFAGGPWLIGTGFGASIGWSPARSGEFDRDDPET